MNGNDIAFLVLGPLAFGAAWVAVSKVRAWKARDAQRNEPTIAVLRDIDSVPMGSLMIITYPGRLTPEQRAAIEGSARVKLGDKIKVMILDGGLKATFVQSPVPMPSPGRKGAPPPAPPPPPSRLVRNGYETEESKRRTAEWSERMKGASPHIEPSEPWSNK